MSNIFALNAFKPCSFIFQVLHFQFLYFLFTHFPVLQLHTCRLVLYFPVLHFQRPRSSRCRCRDRQCTLSPLTSGTALSIRSLCVEMYLAYGISTGTLHIPLENIGSRRGYGLHRLNALPRVHGDINRQRNFAFYEPTI